MITTFIRLLEVPVDGKAAALRLAAAARPDLNGPARTFLRDPNVFAGVPGSPFAYWASDDILGLFRRLEAVHANGTTVVSTNPMNDDFRYVRAWWEPAADRLAGPWKPWAKGGAQSRIYYDIDTVVQWDASRDTYLGFLGTESRQRERPVAGVQHFFRPGLTWPRRTNGLSFRVLPAGSIFADKGPAIFVNDDSPHRLLSLAALVNCATFGYLVSVQLARTELAQSFEVGLIQQTPVPDLSDADSVALAHLARRAWSLKRIRDSANETSHAFTLPAAVGKRPMGFDRIEAERELAAIQCEIDDRAFDLYKISSEDRGIIEASSKGVAPAAEGRDDGDGEDDREDVKAGPPDGAPDKLLSWCVGVAFGRFDPRLATRERAIPPEPEPFDPLPARSPGMWPADEPQDPPPPAILLDDPGHKLDLVGHVTAVATRVSCTVPETLRHWLAHDFFPLHIKMYSKSRRKAPIYWQLATSSASYSVWLHLHGSSKDTLYQAQKHVDDKLDHEQRQLERMRSELGPSPKAAERAKLDAQGTFVDELRTMLAEVQRVAPLWNPNLDDGVVINFSVLHRLVPQNKSWQQELRTTWAALAQGEYDWAHLAMHLWPERVVPKCATDRSLAIAHGLEELFWLEGADKKWKARAAPTRPIEELVRERTSAAVKAALKSLDEAPLAGGGSKKPKNGKKRK